MKFRNHKAFAATLAIAATILCMAQLEGSKADPRPVAHPVPAIQDTETTAQRDARMAWWREARFGMFIHWGLYSIPAGTWDGKQTTHIGEWIMNDMSIPVASYEALARQFNPTGFNAHDIVALAKSAGMKYIVITSKHHDGFAMFDSRANSFNIVAATPYHHDPIRNLAEECRKQGVKLGFYYSQDQDWTAPGGDAILRGNHDPVTHHWDRAQDGSFDKYLDEKAIPQIEELLNNYGEFPAVVWFDTPTANMTPERAAKIVTLLNKYPKLIWNNRLGGTYPGDTRTPEQYIPPQGYPGEDWESCMTINGTWGYKSFDVDFKSSETLLRNLIDIASKGGNYLLNIGPDSHGIVPQPEVDRLHDVGKWMAANGEAVYGTTSTLFGPEAGSFSATEKDKQGKPKFVPSWEWRSTTKADRIYIELFKWPDEKFHLDHSPRNVTKAYLLADPKHALRVTHAGEALDVELPKAAPDPVASVLVLMTR